MMIRVNGEYLDFNDDIEVERQVKLFEDVSGINGDFSYQFSIPVTDNNLQKLGLTTPGNTVFPYTLNDAEVQSNSGVTIHSGFLRIEYVHEEISASFFSNNNNWLNEMKDDISNFNLSGLDKDGTEENIEASWVENKGIVWPLVDRGTLYQRRDAILYDNDFQPMIYVRDAIKSLLNQKGIKLDGDILKDSIYNSLITGNNSLAGVQERINDRKSYIGKASSQTFSSASATRVTFTDTSLPYYNSPNNNWDTVQSRYVTDIRYKKLNVSGSLKVAVTGATVISLQVVGSDSITAQGKIVTVSSNQTISFSYDFERELAPLLPTGIPSGATFEVRLSLVLGSSFTVLTGSTVTVNPIKFLRVYATQLLPQMPASDFIAQIFRLFNVIVSYNSHSKTINTVLFKNLKETEEIDLSPYVSKIVEENYTDFINEYGQKTMLRYSQQDTEQVKRYNQSNNVEYGNGVITIENDFISEQEDLFELDFVSVFQNQVDWLGTKLPLLNMVEFNETDDIEFTSVTDNGDGTSRFNFSGTNPFDTDKLLKITDSTNSAYEGVFRILDSQPTYVRININFDTTATGTLIGLEIIDIDNEDQALLLNVPSQNITNFSTLTSIEYDGAKSVFSLAYFYLDNTKSPINNAVKECLCFDSVSTDSFYQITLKDKYYKEVSSMLNNPFMPKCEMTIPESIFTKMDGTKKIRLRTNRFNALFFQNLVSGYKGSDQTCEVEVIKL